LISSPTARVPLQKQKNVWAQHHIDVDWQGTKKLSNSPSSFGMVCKYFILVCRIYLR
jgi:hypothetical protein